MGHLPWRSQKRLGPQPFCRECGREEVAATGGLCGACTGRLRYQKKSAAEHLKACHEIAERLYKIDRVKYKDVFGWINAQVKKRKSLTLVLHSLDRLESMIQESLPRGVTSRSKPVVSVEAGTPRGNVWAYLEGTLRRLEEKAEAEKLRRSGVTRIGDIPLNLRELAAMKGGK